MKQKINIYSNIKSYEFFNQIVNKYILNYKTIDDLLFDPIKNDQGGIIINNNINKFEIDLNLLSKNYIVITSNKEVNKSFSKTHLGRYYQRRVLPKTKSILH